MPALDHTPLRRVAIKLATKRSSLHSIPQQPIAPHFRSPRAAIDGLTSVRLSCSLGPLATARLFLAQHQSRSCFKEPANLLRKTLQLVTSRSHTHNLTAKQRAPSSQKRAGAETTLRTAWIERSVLSVFCLINSPAGGGSKQFPETVVVPGGWNWSPQFFTNRLLGRVELKRWLVEGDLRCRGGFAGGK